MVKLYLKKIKNKFLSFYDYLDCLINKSINRIKFRFYFILFGKHLGTYQFDEETGNNYLKYPIIILNNTLLLELEEYDPTRLQRFIDNKFGDWKNDWTWAEKEIIFEEKLKELLKGKFFPLESPVCLQNIEYQLLPTYFSFSDNILDSLKYRQTGFPDDFTLNLYKEWKNNSEFLTYVICKFIGYYVFESSNLEFDFRALKFTKDSSIYNNHVILDLTPFFLFQEQIDTVVNDLEKNFQYEIENYKKHYYCNRVRTFIINLKNIKKSDKILNKFPTEKMEKNFKKIGFIFLIISPIFPLLISILCDLILYFFIYKIKYVYLLTIISLYFLLKNKFNLKIIIIKFIEFVKSQYKILFLTYILTNLISLFFKYFIKRFFFYKNIFKVFPILISTKDRNVYSLLKERELQNSLKLILLGRYTQNIEILRHNKNILWSNDEKVKRNIGISIQSIRQENPFLVNHKFLKNFRWIFKSLDQPYNGKSQLSINLSNQSKEIYRKGIEELYNIPKTTEFKDWLDNLLVDPDEKNSLNYPRDIPPIFQYLKKIKLKYNSPTGENIKRIFRLKMEHQGDIIINLEGSFQNHYDIKDGFQIFIMGHKTRHLNF
jgi:hypothetical protein